MNNKLKNDQEKFIFKYKYLICLIIIILILALIITDWYYYKERFYPGVYIENLYVGNKTKNEVKAMLQESFQPVEESSAGLIFNDEKILSVKCADAGLIPDWERTLQNAFKRGRFDLVNTDTIGNPVQRTALLIEKTVNKIELTVNEENLSKVMAEIAEKISVLPENAYFSPMDGTVEIKREVEGRYLKTGATRENFIKAWEENRWDINETEHLKVEIATGVWPPAAVKDDLEKMGVEEIINSFSTTVSSGQVNRNHNIALASSFLDGYLMAPGEIFSFNSVVGNASAEAGFKEAPVIIDGVLRSGVGGGICQVSSTLYNNALLANLEIVERYNHSLPVTYISPGRDATIAYDYLDLKFHNNLPYYILITAALKNYQLKIDFYGRKGDIEVKIINTDRKEVPAPIVFQKDHGQEPGDIEVVQRGAPGYRVSTWRICYRDGVEIKREKLSEDYYRPKPFIYRVAAE